MPIDDEISVVSLLELYSGSLTSRRGKIPEWGLWIGADL